MDMIDIGQLFGNSGYLLSKHFQSNSNVAHFRHKDCFTQWVRHHPCPWAKCGLQRNTCSIVINPVPAEENWRARFITRTPWLPLFWHVGRQRAIPIPQVATIHTWTLTLHIHPGPIWFSDTFLDVPKPCLLVFWMEMYRYSRADHDAILNGLNILNRHEIQQGFRYCTEFIIS